MPTNILQDYIKRPDLADQVSRSPKTLERWTRIGKGPRVTYIGGEPFYHVDDVKAWLEKCRKTAMMKRGA